MFTTEPCNSLAFNAKIQVIDANSEIKKNETKIRLRNPKVCFGDQTFNVETPMTKRLT